MTLVPAGTLNETAGGTEITTAGNEPGVSKEESSLHPLMPRNHRIKTVPFIG
jgi:hypothetical protein